MKGLKFILYYLWSEYVRVMSNAQLLQDIQKVVFGYDFVINIFTTKEALDFSSGYWGAILFDIDRGRYLDLK